MNGEEERGKKKKKKVKIHRRSFPTNLKKEIDAWKGIEKIRVK